MKMITASEVSVLDDFKGDIETDPKDDQHSIISISSDSGLVTSMSSIEFSGVELHVSSDEGTLVGSDLDYEIDSNLDTDTDEGPQDMQHTSSEPESKSESDMDFCQIMHMR